MSCMLVIPDMSLAEEISAYRRAFLACGDSMDGTGGLRRHENPTDWIAENERCRTWETVPEGWVPATQFVCVRKSDGKIVGMIQVRHTLNDYLSKYGGHIGYSVHPDERRKGYASAMLRGVLPYCRELGLERVLVTCDAGNEGSRRAILKNGGVYDGTMHEPEEDADIERYLIALEDKGEKTMSSKYIVKRVAAPDWDAVEAVEMKHQPWLEPCDIAAKAQLCHDGENLYVRLEAEERNIRAEQAGLLDQVCNDSCLEFFFAPKADDKRYLNFEVNLLGNLYVGFGAERPTRVRQIVKSTAALFDPKPFRTDRGWGIEYKIPKAYVNLYFPDAQYAGEAAGNFYKCGDLTEKPHYLAWAPLSCEKPDYHRRWDFGTLVFE